MASKEVVKVKKVIKGILLVLAVGLLVSVVILCSQTFYNRAWTHQQKVDRIRGHYMAVLKDNPNGFSRFKQSPEYVRFEQTKNVDSVEYYYRAFFDTSFKHTALR